MDKLKSLPVISSDILSLASHSFSRIHGMSMCALRALESPDGASDLESIAQVLQAISLDASLGMNDIDVESERLGIRMSDESWTRRLDAQHAASKLKGGAV